LDALRRSAPAKERAAFTVVGDPLVRIPLRVPWPEALRSIMIVVALALAAVGIGYGLNRWRG
jgi:hypothetical protein